MSHSPRLTFKRVTLNLRNPFRISYGVSDTRDAFILRLEGGQGLGEGTIPPYYRVDPTEMTHYWDRAAALPDPFPETLAAIPSAIPDGPAPARSALDLAFHDRLARRLNLPLYALLGLPKPAPMPSSFTIGIEAPEVMARMAREIPHYNVIKLKLGSDDDEARVKAVRQARPDAKLRVDANAGWTLDQALAHLNWLERYNLELIEQPLAKDQIPAMGVLQAKTSIPILADESVQSLDDVKRLADAGVQGINLKLMKVGGLAPAIAILHLARQRQMKIMLGCMIESSLGTTAMAHLAGLADFADLDAPLLITNDPFTGLIFDQNARFTVPDRPGIGAIPIKEPA